jgi:hypothetical protein
MAIEKKFSKAKPLSFDSEPEESTEQVDELPADESSEHEMAESPQEESKEQASGDDDTATLSIDMLGGKQVNPGDIVRLEVTSVNPDDGTVTVKYATAGKPGIAKAANAFDEGM